MSLQQLPNMLNFANRATGEIEEWPLAKPDQVEAAHVYATELEKAAKELREALRPYDEALVADGDGKSYTFASGNQLTHITSQVFKVPADEVMKHIDLSVIKDAVSITKGKLEAIIAELVKNNEIDAEAAQAIQKSYIPVRANDYFTVQKARKHE